ncbi:hypothetical protein A2856_02625 [Candidatus Uhrbacteria bacterium RIFCSPHIGHO2_01_FULL_63_20]|uniref:Uncharacterized protein n=1 Tax=Candidatus Uhrbacteria bacterium RIFCSPHIGHO2_01_FULL_63_20 TaxID=1802385 RepID=A0A1F7TKR4_9BACT|nr:MAG: hypothetical protein A2856_02625 [Candidatus Uhrbacteria bacterium RIFCSPHIGHO2_01_FULL_63_20]
MRTSIVVFAVLISSSLFTSAAHAQMMGNYTVTDDGHTAREEAEGKAIAEKLAAGSVDCATLTADDFERLGEYYMGLMAGDAHVAMNAMMTRQLGASGEERMHALMGKRLSGCDPTAGDSDAVPGSSWFPMMSMMSGFAGSGWGTGMMGFGSQGWNAVSLINVLLLWTIGVLTIALLVRAITRPRTAPGTKGK